MKNRKFVVPAVLLSAVVGWSAGFAPVLAHEADCPFCTLPVVQDTATQDNEVALKFGRKKIEYRCVYCALSEAQSEYSGDLTILAPSEEKSAPVVLTRKAGKWSADPQGVLFAAQKASHKHCQVTYRAFASRAAFDSHVKKHADLFDKDVKPLTLAQMIELTESKTEKK